MFSLLLSMVVFVGALCCHVIVYRVRRSPVAAIIAYPVGLAFLVFFLRAEAFPFTAIFLYCLLVAGYLLYFLSYTNDAESPSAKVLEVIKLYGPLGRRAILAHFTDEELIGMRLTRLIGSGWLVKKDGRFSVTGRGAFIAGLFAWYRGLLGWTDGG